MNNVVRSFERGRGWDVLGGYDNLMGGWLKPARPYHDITSKVPSIDVSENESAFLVQAELPGVGREGNSSLGRGPLNFNFFNGFWALFFQVVF